MHSVSIYKERAASSSTKYKFYALGATTTSLLATASGVVCRVYICTHVRCSSRVVEEGKKEGRIVRVVSETVGRQT
ncbi:hypothetical protein B0H12DRAFT_1150396 [Mycena haematopus]|nr:hypothetical protein B0H12DRAFT_1150396 [Mycena haematopus]